MGVGVPYYGVILEGMMEAVLDIIVVEDFRPSLRGSGFIFDRAGRASGVGWRTNSF